MQTALADFIKDTPEGRQADAILRKCVHCGFCNATCPTYQLLGDELDGPRGRIYLMKQVLEGATVTVNTQLHLDRCLTCRACETTCPSGVQYGHLVDIGRAIVDSKVPRSLTDRIKRRMLSLVLPRRALFGLLMLLGGLFRGLLPKVLAGKIPEAVPSAGSWPVPRHARKMLVLAGCVQPALSPDINAAAARVLDHVGITLSEVEGAGCCGGLRYHLNYQQDGLNDMRHLIDAWWPLVERGEVEAIVMTASGCGVTVKDYAHLLAGDAVYSVKAKRISAMTRDLSEVLVAERDRLMTSLAGAPASQGILTRVAFHAPCSLQHGQQLRGGIESLLIAAGCELTPVADAHLCCGSAGTYSLLQPALSGRLKDAKLAALQSGAPQLIVTANIGCQNQLASASAVPVRHWITVLDEALSRSATQGVTHALR